MKNWSFTPTAFASPSHQHESPPGPPARPTDFMEDTTLAGRAQGQQQQEQPAPSEMEIFVVSDLMEAPADPPPENKLSSLDRNFLSRQIFN